MNFELELMNINNRHSIKFCSPYCYPSTTLQGVIWKFITHTKEKPSAANWHFSQNWCLLLIFIYSNSKFKSHILKFGLWIPCIRTHTKGNPPKISSIIFDNLPFHPKKYSRTKWPSCEFWNQLLLMTFHQIHSEMVHFNISWLISSV